MKKGIFGTDLNKPVNELVNDVRNALTKARGMISDIQHGYPGYKERLDPTHGLLTSGIIVLHREIEDIIKHQIRCDDEGKGKSIPFNSRGLGLDTCPGCFVCGGETAMLTNISSFVRSKEDGEEIVSWFEHGAYLDYRENEPNWIQVKIGACTAHRENINRLNESNPMHNVLRKCDVIEAMKEGKQC